MPRGTVRWFDPQTQEGIVVHLGREYPVRAEDMELETRAARARVHFDVERSAGVDRAVRVRGLTGTRSGHGRGRSGLEIASHHPDERGGSALARGRPELRARHPRAGADVVGRWLEALRRGSVAAALALYAPDARMHGEREQSGRRSIEAWLEASPLLGRELLEVSVNGEGERVTRVDWHGPESPRTDVDEGVVRLRVEHGRIREQWS